MIIATPVTLLTPQATSAPWTPASLGSLIQWLTADAGIGVSDGSQFGTWTDQSSSHNNATQSTSGDKFTFSATGGPNSKPAALLAGSQYMTCTGSTGYTSASIFVVVSGEAATTQYFLDYYPGINAMGFGSSGTFLFQPNGYAAPSPPSYTGVQWYLAEGHMDGSTAYFGVNDSITSFSASGTFTPNYLGSFGGFFYGLTGGFAQIIICAPMLNSTDQASVRSYLNSEYLLY